MSDLTDAGELEAFQAWYTAAFGEGGFVTDEGTGEEPTEPTDDIPEALRPIIEWISQ